MARQQTKSSLSWQMEDRIRKAVASFENQAESRGLDSLLRANASSNNNYMQNDTHPAQEKGAVRIPTVGRQVHYFPNGHDLSASANGATVLPATVIQPFGERINIQVQTMNPDAHTLLRYSVPHKTILSMNDSCAYWDWPEIK